MFKRLRKALPLVLVALRWALPVARGRGASEERARGVRRRRWVTVSAGECRSPGAGGVRVRRFQERPSGRRSVSMERERGPPWYG